MNSYLAELRGKPLAPCETRVLRLVAEGLSNKQIATQLHYSVGVIKAYVSRILTKLEMDSRTQLALWYWKALVNAEHVGEHTLILHAPSALLDQTNGPLV